MTTVRLASGTTFDVGPGVPILEAGEGKGVRLSYSCRTGRCSSCKARVSSGTTTSLHDESGLEPGESDAGWILTCVRTPSSDVTFAQDNELTIDLPRPTTQPLRLNSVARVADDVVVVTFRLPPSSRWTYLPGQHVEIIGTGGVRRAYSMASAPSPQGVELHVKRISEGALSEYWFDKAAPDDLLRLYGPLGTFVLRSTERPLILLATGTGAAPVKALLEQLLDLESAPPVRVYVGARTRADLYWTPAGWDERGAAPTDWPTNWAFLPVLSRPDVDWLGRVGHVQDVLVADVPDLAGYDVYACGSDAMIHDARQTLLESGLVPSRMFSGAFVESAPPEDDA